MNWQPIETAPKGSGENGPRNVRDPAYVEPPILLIWSEEGPVVGYYDWYYHPGYGCGAEPNEPAWRSHPEGGRIYGAKLWTTITPPEQP